MFKVKEIFYSLQGEGHYAGVPSVFCRFVGCNKWSGREADRSASVCSFCDTDFLGGSTFSEDALVDAILATWPGGGRPRVVFTGGEPALQLTESLVSRIKRAHFNVAVETNGSVELPGAWPMWITVSPKDMNIVVRKGHELKVLWPNPLTPPEAFADMEFHHFFIQPISGVLGAVNSAVEYVKANPQWALSLQQHKVLGIR